MLLLNLLSVAYAAREPSARACVRSLTHDLGRPIGRPSRARELIVIRGARDADDRFPEVPGVGYRIIRLQVPYPPHPDSRVGRWMIVPVNEPFALDTYTSLVELNELHERTIAMTPERRRAVIGGFLRLPDRVSEAMDWSPFKNGRAIERRLGAHLWARGRRLHCYDVEGQIY